MIFLFEHSLMCLSNFMRSMLNSCMTRHENNVNLKLIRAISLCSGGFTQEIPVVCIETDNTVWIKSNPGLTL